MAQGGNWYYHPETRWFVSFRGWNTRFPGEKPTIVRTWSSPWKSRSWLMVRGAEKRLVSPRESADLISSDTVICQTVLYVSASQSKSLCPFLSRAFFFSASTRIMFIEATSTLLEGEKKARFFFFDFLTRVGIFCERFIFPGGSVSSFSVTLSPRHDEPCFQGLYFTRGDDKSFDAHRVRMSIVH